MSPLTRKIGSSKEKKKRRKTRVSGWGGRFCGVCGKRLE